jgi:hypothetical protein
MAVDTAGPEGTVMRRIAMAAALALAACGGGSDDGSGGPGGGSRTARCVQATAGICWQYSGMDDFQFDQMQTSCPQTGGAFTEAACPPENRVGRCTAATGNISVTYAYYGPTWDAGNIGPISSTCAGTWTPG